MFTHKVSTICFVHQTQFPGNKIAVMQQKVLLCARGDDSPSLSTIVVLYLASTTALKHCLPCTVTLYIAVF